MVIDRFTRLDDLPELLRVEELARLADVSTGAVREDIKRGRLPVVKIGRLHRIPRTVVARWLTCRE